MHTYLNDQAEATTPKVRRAFTKKLWRSFACTGALKKSTWASPSRATNDEGRFDVIRYRCLACACHMPALD